MKPDQYRIEGRKPGASNWGTFEYVSSLNESSVIKRASALGNEFRGMDWRVLLYWEVVDEWVITWDSPAEKPKPTEFEHRGVVVAPGDSSGLWVKGVSAEVYLGKDEVAALRAYFASEGE